MDACLDVPKLRLWPFQKRRAPLHPQAASLLPFREAPSWGLGEGASRHPQHLMSVSSQLRANTQQRPPLARSVRPTPTPQGLWAALLPGGDSRHVSGGGWSVADCPASLRAPPERQGSR